MYSCERGIHHKMDLVQTANIGVGYWRNFEIFHVFFASFDS